MNKIVFVEDDPEVGTLIAAYLGKHDMDVVVEPRGDRAEEVIAREKPDLVLLDIMMPDMDGYEVMRRLRADPRWEDLPVIFLTALNNTEDIVKGFKLGANDYVSKPFNHEELITRVAHHIFIAASKRTILEQSEQLQRTMRNRDRMYSVIAHDLRSPIGTLKMVFNMLTLNITCLLYTSPSPRD